MLPSQRRSAIANAQRIVAIIALLEDVSDPSAHHILLDRNSIGPRSVEVPLISCVKGLYTFFDYSAGLEWQLSTRRVGYAELHAFYMHPPRDVVGRTLVPMGDMLARILEKECTDLQDFRGVQSLPLLVGADAIDWCIARAGEGAGRWIQL